MPVMIAAAATGQVPTDDPAAALAALRAEIDGIDDALHDLLMRRAEVVSILAGSRVKGGASPLRPGREAMILRRLLARHQGALHPAAVVRLWREIFAASSALQGGFAVAVQARGPEHVRLAREHFGSVTPLRAHPTAARALAAVADGEAQVAVLPLPEEGEPPGDAWWLSLEAPRLQVIARLPFLRDDGQPEALAIAPGAPDPSGADRSFLRLETSTSISRAQLQSVLAAAGLPVVSLLIRRDGPMLRALAEVEGVVEAGDPRLGLAGFDQVLPLGFAAIPAR